MTPLSLPLPDADAQQHSNRLKQQICREIDLNSGAIDFSRFMELALYAPGLGYYAAGAQKFGSHGDFVTAPELSPLFGGCLAERFRQVRRAVGVHAQLWEIGAGSGALARALLADLAATDELPPAYLILEPNADLRARQHIALAEAPCSVVWIDDFPKQFNGLVIANEVLDAIPTRRFQVTETGPRWLLVAHDDGQLRYQLGDGAVLPLDTAPLPLGYINEFNALHRPWLESLRAALGMATVLLIDYGERHAAYYHPTRTTGWLRCYYRHRVHDDPFWFPGLQDLTTSVNFTPLMETAQSLGLFINELEYQGRFLMNSGIAPRFEAAFACADTRQQVRLAQQMRTLLLPDEMGERFKVLTLATYPRNSLCL